MEKQGKKIIVAPLDETRTIEQKVFKTLNITPARSRGGNYIKRKNITQVVQNIAQYK